MGPRCQPSSEQIKIVSLKCLISPNNYAFKKLNQKECKTRKPWTLVGLERKLDERGQLRAHHAASLLILAPWSSFPLARPLSTLPYLGWYTGPFMGEKLGRCKTQVPKVWTLFIVSVASSGIWLHCWLLARRSRRGGPDSGPGQRSAELLQVWWVSPSL